MTKLHQIAECKAAKHIHHFAYVIYYSLSLAEHHGISLAAVGVILAFAAIEVFIDN